MDDYDDTEPFEFESATSPPPEGGLVNCQTFPSSIVQFWKGSVKRVTKVLLLTRGQLQVFF